MSQRLHRLEGRLFAEDGCLFLVVHADDAGGVASVSCRIGEEIRIIEMPLAEVTRRLTAGLLLDNLNGPQAARRIRAEEDGWYFESREGSMGPYETRREAGQQLIRHVLRMQTAAASPAPPLPATPARRRGDPPAI